MIRLQVCGQQRAWTRVFLISVATALQNGRFVTGAHATDSAAVRAANGNDYPLDAISASARTMIAADDGLPMTGTSGKRLKTAGLV